MKLQPKDVFVDIGNLATFNCSVSCELSQTHTLQWFVGYSPDGRRLVDSEFEQRTGIQALIKVISGCSSGQKGGVECQQLSVNASSIERLNRTAVQCAALRKSSSLLDIYSHYGVILVNGKSTAIHCNSIILWD